MMRPNRSTLRLVCVCITWIAGVPTPTAAAPSPQANHAAFQSFPRGDTGAGPIVTEIVNRRSPDPPLTLKVSVDPNVADDTKVRWSSLDGMNEIAVDGFEAARQRDTTIVTETTVAHSVGIFPHENAVGDATIVADVGPPVNVRLTMHVRDRIGIGFGCYGFMAQGRSVRIADGRPQPSTLAQADIAVVGPGMPQDTTPGYGCWGENFDPQATSYRVVFGHGGRVAGEPGPLQKAFPFDTVASIRALDVEAADGRMYRLHLGSGAGVYFTGTIERIDAMPAKVRDHR